MDVTRAESRPTKPRFIHGAMILLWGLHSDLILAALPLAIVLEARHLTTLRWDLDKSDFYRVADLTRIAFVAMVVYLLVNARETHFIITMLQWLPILFYPLLIVHALSLNSRMSLDVLFYGYSEGETCENPARTCRPPGRYGAWCRACTAHAL